MSQSINHNLNLNSFRQRAWQMAFADGLQEIIAGVVMVSIALFFASDVLFGDTIFLIYLVPILLIQPMRRVLKVRYTFPRIGEVSVLPEQSLLLGAAMLGGLVFMLTVVFVMVIATDGPPPVVTFLFDYLILWVGLGYGGFGLLLAARYGITRYYGFGAFCIGVGIVFQFLLDFSAYDDPNAARWGLGLGLMGGVLLIAGIVQFVRFVQENPVLDAPDDDEEAYHA